jgi:hypothetical protein
MDNHYFLIQTEMILRPWNRFQLNAFLSYGEVASTQGNLFSYPTLSFGGGLRFQFIKANPTLIRMDIGINQDGSTGLYFAVNEAF